MFTSDVGGVVTERPIQVVEIAQNLVTNGPPDRLRTFYAFLKQQRIKLAVSIGMLT